MLIVAYGLINVMNKHVYTHIKNKNITWQISAFFAAFFTLLYLDQNSSSASLAYYRRGRNWGSAWMRPQTPRSCVAAGVDSKGLSLLKGLRCHRRSPCNSMCI